MGVSFSLARPKASNSSIRVKISTQGANFSYILAKQYLQNCGIIKSHLLNL